MTLKETLIDLFEGEEVKNCVLKHKKMVQHIIQEEEDFARGGSNKDRRYHRLAGEVEARNICIRHFLTPEVRRKNCIQTHNMCLTRSNLCLFSYKNADLHNKIKDMPFYFIGYNISLQTIKS